MAGSSRQLEEGDEMQRIFYFFNFLRFLIGLTCGALSRSAKEFFFAT
jgi:hypothetical protein